MSGRLSTEFRMSGLAALLHGGSSVAQASRWDSNVGLGQEGTRWPATSGWASASACVPGVLGQGLTESLA